MAYIIIGQRKLGIEFMIAIGSYFSTFLMGHFVTLRSGIESYVFYVVGIYNVLMYVAIAFSDPGWLDASQKQRINKLVGNHNLPHIASYYIDFNHFFN